jgi:adenylosuccinate lyase
MPHDRYENPLETRYASAEMSALWSAQRKHSLWRQLWVWLAEAEAELGLPITPGQIAELRAHVDDIDFAAADRYERELRHDVMAHVHAYGDVCPSARPIIHLGATSCYVTDNADLMLIREALELTARRTAAVIDRLGTFAAQHRDLPTLGFTHLQPAQPTTVGRRACLWAYDLALDLAEIEHRLASLRARSTKGTTGTQASFLHLFDGDRGKVRELERRVAAKMGFAASYAVTGQTYPRKIDAQAVDALAGIAASAHKAATDLRILAHRKEVEEPFEKQQIGSSAMAYKRNPMRAERLCSLARFLMGLPAMAAQTHATQWFERTLDDSAARRLYIPQAFLTADACLRIGLNVARGLAVNAPIVAKGVREYLPYMATENLIMAAVAAGADRQDVHEVIRQHSHAVTKRIKDGEGVSTELFDRLKGEPAFAGVDFAAATDANLFVGRSPEQVTEFVEMEVEPIRRRYADQLGQRAELKV